MKTADHPRVLLESVTSQPRIRWRAVVDRKEDSHGITREVRIIELADEADKDGMGIQRWRSLSAKSAQTDWMLVCESALSLVLQESHDEPQQSERKQQPQSGHALV